MVGKEIKLLTGKIAEKALQNSDFKKRTARKLLLRIKNCWQLYLFLIIPISYIILFSYVPMYGAQIAFKKYSYTKGIWGSPWVGFKNFTRFFEAYYFWRLIWNTISISLYNLIAGFPFPIIFAVGLNYLLSNRYKKVVQTVTYAPHFISTVVIVGMLMQLLSPRMGPINSIIRFLGNEPINFMGIPGYFRHIHVWSGIWQHTGWNSILYIAALSGISIELHEAAIVDGANKIQRIWLIDIPGILPTAAILLILSFSSILSVGFEKTYLMQNSLNLRVSEVINTFVYNVGIAEGASNFAYATAIGLFQSLIGFLLVMFVNAISKRIGSARIW
jgi:putative aldouronate transport system permease protein